MKGGDWFPSVFGMAATADLFQGLKDESSALSAEVMEAFASGVKLDLAAGVRSAEPRWMT